MARSRERTFERALMLSSFVSLATTAAIVIVLVSESVQFWMAQGRTPFDHGWGDVGALLAGTVLTTAVAVVVALPIGLLSAIYLVEFASPWVLGILRPSLELLANVPTVVYGYFALAIVTPFLREIVPGLGTYNAVGPGVVTGLMLIPLVSSLSGEAIAAVPGNLREAAYALGVSRLRTLFFVILPRAATTISGATLLGLSRALGETMIVLVAAGTNPRLTFDPRDSVTTMASHVALLAAGELTPGTTFYGWAFTVGTALFIATFTTHALARRRLGKVPAP